MVLIASHCQSGSRILASSMQICMEGSTHLNVPTPPASRIKDVSVNGFPVHRIANARRMCPCATTSTSPASSGLSKQGRWYFSLMSAITASRRRTISSGDLVDVSMIHITPSIPDCNRSKTPISKTHSTRRGKRRKKWKRKTYSPPGHPSVQIFQGSMPFSALCFLISFEVNPS
jgi:hypothetical protein